MNIYYDPDTKTDYNIDGLELYSKGDRHDYYLKITIGGLIDYIRERTGESKKFLRTLYNKKWVGMLEPCDH